jgi:signal transduction histidine kinase/DNA-binding response OmpR family regulator
MSSEQLGGLGVTTGSGSVTSEQLVGVQYRRPMVLIVDDEPAILDFLEGCLSDGGYDIRTCGNAFEALDLIIRRRPEVALVDLKMPGMSGMDLMKSARAESPFTSFIVITGHTTIDSVLEAIRQGVHDYLTKPFSSSDTVRLVVRNAVEKHNLTWQIRVQAMITGMLLRLAETSCVGEGREVFFGKVREVFIRLLDATSVGVAYRDGERAVSVIDTRIPLTREAASMLEERAMRSMGLSGEELDRRVVLASEDITSPVLSRMETILDMKIGAEGAPEAMLMIGHQNPRAFSRDAVKIASLVVRNISLIVQQQKAGAGHEDQMIVDLLHHMKDGVVLMDRRFHVRYANPQVRRVLGLSEDTPLDQVREALAAADPALVTQRTAKSFTSALQKQVAMRVGDEERFYDVEAYNFYTPAKVGYRAILFRDVSHLRRETRKVERLNKRLKDLNEELTERNKRLEALIRELDNFAYIASHDLQEPFRHIEIFAQFLERDMSGENVLPTEVAYYLGQIRQNVDIAKRLLSDLRTLSRITRMQNPHRDCSLVDLVEEVLERFASTMEQCGGRVTVGPMPSVRCDPIKVKEVFHNLVSNAFKYNESTPPTVEVEAAEEGGVVTVSVKDNGIGIAPEYHEYVFQPCRRIPFKEETRGSGLGLAIVKKVIEEHGGKIWLESEPGKGSTFRFTLPAAGGSA